MPAALRLHLTDDARAEVAQCFETTPDAETRLRGCPSDCWNSRGVC